MKRTTSPRSERLAFNTTPEIKQQLKTMAKERGWSPSLLVHEVMRAWLEEKLLTWYDQVDKNEK